MQAIDDTEDKKLEKTTTYDQPISYIALGFLIVAAFFAINNLLNIRLVDYDLTPRVFNLVSILLILAMSLLLITVLLFFGSLFAKLFLNNINGKRAQQGLENKLPSPKTEKRLKIVITITWVFYGLTMLTVMTDFICLAVIVFTALRLL
ncbi:MAG: hypothetical protein FK734_17955 [Asgard group archaeon]|nr:hypothetical protein [Asgard group archaeon]